MVQLAGSAQSVSLGQPGYAIRAPGMVGSAELRAPLAGRTRSLRSGLDTTLPALDAALVQSQVTTTREIDLNLQPAAGPAGAAGALRSAHGTPAIELELPDPGPDYGQVVMSIDDAGAIRWHLAVAPTGAGATAASRGGGGSQRFRIEAALPPPAPQAVEGQQRSVLGAVARRLLKVLVYPWSDQLIGGAINSFVSRWEADKRPYRLRRFTPDHYRIAGADPIDGDGIAQLAQGGPVLLFVHGTFSTSHAAFDNLAPDAMAELHQRYGGRLVAFDHPTLSESPAANIQWLLQQLPPQRFTADIVCHSRGGLVSRLLAERPAGFGLEQSPLDVRRVVLAGVPNAGTPLSEPEHMADLIDRLTTALCLIPSGPVSETLEALVTVVKLLGRGLLTGLDGLVAMRPEGAFLQALNAAGGTPQTYYAIASDYKPQDRGLRALLSGAADNVLDMIFKDAANDLVVPTEGVFGKNGNANFPLPPDRVLVLRPTTAMHMSLFGDAKVSQRMLEWLD